MKHLVLLFIAFFTGGLLQSIVFAGDLRVEIPYGDDFADIISEGEFIEPSGSEQSFKKFIQLANTYLWIVVLIVLMMMLIYAGFTILTSMGDQEKLKKGNKILLFTGIGFIVALLSYALINIVVNFF